MAKRFLFVERTMMRTLACLALSLCLASPAVAAQNGIFVGIGLGDLQTNMSQTEARAINGNIPDLATPVSIKSSELGGKVFVGYNINDFVGVEAAYKLFVLRKNKNKSANDVRLKPEIIEVAAKFMFNIDPITLFVKAGVADIKMGVEYNDGTTTTTKTDDETSSLIGIGIAYAFSANVEIDLTFERFKKSGNIPDVDYIGVNLSYFFNAKQKCGELLC